MEKVIRFKLEGFDPFIDFIKAYAIICVLIGHTVPHPDYYGYGLWAGMQVPLFVLVQSFHSLKKEYSHFSLKKILWRLFVPFLLLQLLLLTFLLFLSDTESSYYYNEFLVGGGYGPGSYFPWVYLQIAIILPLIHRFINKGSKFLNFILAIIICEGFEILQSIIDLPEDTHRLLAIRYFFLIYFGWLWVKEGIIINWKTTLLSLLSLFSIIYFEYFSVDDEPFFYQTAWSIHRWPCYYYVAIWGGYLLWSLFNVLNTSVH